MLGGNRMKNITLKKPLLRLCSLLILIPILLLSACNKNDNNATQTTTQDQNPPRKMSIDELFNDINQNKLPPLEEEPEGDITNPGDRIPVQYLERAPQDLVGEKIQISFSDLKTDLVYRYKVSEKQLVIIYSGVMLVMRTEYADMKEFLSISDLWTGTVTAVKIVCAWDSHYSENSVKHRADVKATEASAVCYGIVTPEKKISAYDSIQPNEEYSKYGAGFDLTVTRFGIE